ncbi:MAG: hypothetical protein QQN63_01530 [Nitrosopumilus sp.]
MSEHIVTIDMDHNEMTVEIRRLRVVLMERHKVERVTKLALWVALIFAIGNLVGIVARLG